MAAVSGLIERLDYLLLADGAPAKCEGNLKKAVEQLRSELDEMEKFLSNGGDLKISVAQIFYQIEDAVESYVLQEAAPKGRLSTVRSIINRPGSSGSSRLQEDLENFSKSIRKLRAGKSSSKSSSSTSRVLSGAAPKRLESRVLREQVANLRMRDDTESLKSTNLMNGKSELSIISITGMGGIGKTILARSLYTDPSVADHFDIRAWATIGSDFQARDVLETILFSFQSRGKDETGRMETMELMELLYKSLKGRRYLLVLDDIWETKTWDTLRYAFPNDQNGSRIVITTRNSEVARYAAPTYVHEMDLLSEDESWELFKKACELQDLDIQRDPRIETIGKQIVKFCRGIPLSIVLIGRSLRGMDLEYWDVMLQKLQEPQDSESVQNILALSYNELPFYLKPCFLYLGHLPHDQAIQVEKLCLLWIAEGLIPRAENNKTRMEIAEGYFNQLVYRNLVILVEKEQVSAARSKLCEIHDLILDLCYSIGKQEEFYFESGNKISTSACKLAINLNTFEEVVLNFPETKHIRTILFFDTDESPQKPTWPKEFSDLKEFQKIRVLDFDGVAFQVKKLPRGIEKLMYLRHLSFHGCYLQEFPSSLSNFPLLETLDLRVSCEMSIHNVLGKLSSLRHLYFPLAFRSSNTNEKLKIKNLKKLEILENFHAGVCDAADLLELENLQVFTGTVSGNNTDLKNTISCMNKIKFLRHSSVVVKKFDSYSEERRSIVGSLLECDGVRALEIEGYLGKYPHHEGINYGSNFTEMVFSGSEFSEDPMPMLGKLRKLRSLVLCRDAFVAKKMICSAGDFLQLTSLKLATLQSLEEWVVEKGSMQNLTILSIEKCGKLQTLPALTELPTLQKVMIGSMSEGFQDSVNKMIEEMKKLSREPPTVKFDDLLMHLRVDDWRRSHELE